MCFVWISEQTGIISVHKSSTNLVTALFYPSFPDSRNSTAFGRLPGFAILSFW
jgi:hypothetical protein